MEPMIRHGAVDLSSPIPLPETGKPLPKHPAFPVFVPHWDFYDLSAIGGQRYKEGCMPDGSDIFIPHEAEITPDHNYTEPYKRRKRWATYTNICGPTVNEHVDFVAKGKVNRDTANPQYVEWTRDVTGQGVPVDMDTFMMRALRGAALYGRYYIGMESTRPADDDEQRTEAQSQQMGNRLFLQRIEPYNVIDWRETEDVMTECIVVYAGCRAVLWRQDDFVSMVINRDGVVESIDEPQSHPYGELPIVLMAPFEDLSLIGDLTLQSAKLFNLQSLKDEEMVRRTFTQVYITGADKDEVQQVIQGTAHLICIPNKDAGFHTFGAQIEQAQSLREEEDRIIARMRWLMGLRSPDGEQAETGASGYALKLRYSRIDSRLVRLAKTAESAERAVTRMYSRVFNNGNPLAISPPVYQTNFDIEAVADVLDLTFQVFDRDEMPDRLKQRMASRLASKLLGDATDEDLAEIEQQIMEYFESKGEGNSEEALAELAKYRDAVNESGNEDKDNESEDEADARADARGVA